LQRLRAETLDLKGIVRPGDTILWGHACGEPLTLTEALVQQRHELGGVTVFLGSGFSNTLRPEHADSIRFVGIGASGTHRRLAKAGVLDVLPCHFSKVESYVADGVIPCDVAFVQVAPADDDGLYSLGLVSDYIRAAVRRARVVVAEVNSRVPQVQCAEPLAAADIDYVVGTDRELVELAPVAVTELDRTIAGFAQAYIPDRATVQIGIGAVPEAVMSDLRVRRDLGIHSGMLGDSVAELMECGAVSNAYKEIDPGVTVGGALIGTRRLYDFCHRNRAVRMHPISHTHNIAILSRLSRFVSLNSAIEVDLSGQVNAESVNGQYLGAVGGQVDYVRAATASPGGRSIIALPSTAQAGAVSRIVVSLSGPVTTARSDVDVVITEYGAAELRGRPLSQRARALIAVAHPAHREALERAAQEGAKASAKLVA
jgi:acyl-CoA hydrolase